MFGSYDPNDFKAPLFRQSLWASARELPSRSGGFYHIKFGRARAGHGTTEDIPITDYTRRTGSVWLSWLSDYGHASV